jgi:hypothetical protein
MALQKQDGGIIFGEIWRRCFARLSAMRRLSFLLLLMITLFKQQVSEMVPHTAKILSGFYDNLDTTSDPNDPEVIIKIDISDAFNSTCRALALDVLSGHASRYTMLVASNGGMLLPPARPCLIYVVTFTPCAHAMRSYDTLTGTDRFTLQRAKRGDSRATLREASI